MNKYLHASSAWSAAIWYDAPTGTGVTTAPGASDIGDLNGFNLTVDADISGVGGFTNNSSSGGSLIFSGSTQRTVSVGSSGFYGWKSPLIQVDNGNNVVLNGTLYQGSAQTLSINAGGTCTHYGDRYLSSTGVSLIGNSGTLTLAGGTLYLNSSSSSAAAVTCVSGSTNYFGTSSNPMAVAGTAKGIAFAHNSGTITSYLNLSSISGYGSDSYLFRLSAGTIYWRDQTTTIDAGKVSAFQMTSGTLNISGLQLQCSGDFIGNFGGGTLTTDSNTKLIEMAATAGIAGNLAAFIAKRIKPTIPTTDLVKSGTAYGYNAALTGAMGVGGGGSAWDGGYSA